MLHRFTAPWLNGSNYALDWNGPLERLYKPFDDAALSRPIWEHFEAVAEAWPDRIAIDDGATLLSYREASLSVRRLASVVASRTKPDDLVGILLPTSAHFQVAMLACLAAGRMFVPLDLHYPPQWISAVVAESAVAAIVSCFDDLQAAALVPDSIRKIDIREAESGEICDTLQPAGPDSPAFLLFTSGSTGKPKGIVNSQRNLLRRIVQYVDAAHINIEDNFLPLSSECTIAGLRERITSLVTGARLHLIDVQRAGGRAILNRLHQARTSLIYATPALLRTLMQLGEGKAPESLRVVRVGGEAVLWSDVDLLRGWLSADCRIEIGYSSTEAPIMQWFVPTDFPREGNRVPIGYPLAGNALAIVDEDGGSVAPGEAGELVVRSPYVALGRWIGGRCAGEDFPADPKDPSCRILRTGDLVRLRADGLLDLVGRKDRQIKIRGQRVEPGELEAAIRRQPGVRDVAVLPRQVGRNWWLIAYVVPAEPCPDLAAKLKETLREILPAPLQPQRIHLIAAVPALPGAKIDIKALRALDEEWQRRETETPIAQEDVSPAGKTETAVAEIWKRVLDLDHVDRDADFFDLGGDSLMTLNLMFEIEDALGVELPMTMIYQTPTLASLSAAIDARAAPQFSPLVFVRGGGCGAPLFIVHGIGGNVMELFAAGRQIVSSGPVYAIQARGLDGREEPNRSVADMARYYLEAIRKAYPDGPCHLAGYSSGGLTAFEMAVKLRAMGDAPASLTLIDTQTNERQWPLAIWAGLLLERARHHAAAAAGQSAREKLRYAAKVIGSLTRRILWRLGLGEAPAIAPQSRIPQALRTVHDTTLAAVARYRPGHYDGAVTLVVPDIKDEMMAPVDRIWRRHVTALDVRNMPGDHNTMVKGQCARHLAAILSAAIA